MSSAIQELKIRAQFLHRQIKALDPDSVARLRALPEFRRCPELELRAAAPAIPRRLCLTILALEMGFPDWPHARIALGGEGVVTHFGTLLYPKGCGGHINLWYAGYEEAAAMRGTRGGWLLAWRQQFLVVDRHFIESLGLDPEDPDWEALGYDWARPRDVAARARLYGKLLAALPREGPGPPARSR